MNPKVEARQLKTGAKRIRKAVMRAYISWITTPDFYEVLRTLTIK